MNRSFLFKALLSALLLLPFLGFSQTVIYPAADAYVRHGANAGTNYGADEDLNIRHDDEGAKFRKTYLKFNLPSGFNTSDYTVSLDLQAYKSDHVGTSTFYVGLTSASWSETGINANNDPAETNVISFTESNLTHSTEVRNKPIPASYPHFNWNLDALLAGQSGTVSLVVYTNSGRPMMKIASTRFQSLGFGNLDAGAKLIVTAKGGSTPDPDPDPTPDPPVQEDGFEFVTASIEGLGKSYSPGSNVTERNTQADMGGNTSIRNVDEPNLIWKTQGYYQRNRDIGQVFIPKKDTYLKSLVFRTGNTNNAVHYGTPGAKVFIQFFEIVGTPVINDNGTPQGTNATHGYTTNHRGDDYIDGVTYNSLPKIYQTTFPSSLPVTRDANGNEIGSAGRLYYLRWKFDEPQFFEANKRYGFIMGFVDPKPGQSFTLANVNKAAVGDVPSLNDAHTPYAGGWSFRREGDGTLPPTQIPGTNPPSDDATEQGLITESLFREYMRYSFEPTSDGYPDVDTYRALEFYLEEEDVTTPPTPPADGTVVVKVASSNDDAEETVATGAISLTSNDLDVRSTDISGMRFKLDIPQGATIDEAKIKFIAKTTNSGSNTFTFKAQSSDNANAFSSSAYNISSRSTTSSSVTWATGDWNAEGVYTSPNLASIVQEVVDRSGWNANNHIVITITSNSGSQRSAKTYDFSGNTSSSPELTVKFTEASSGAPAVYAEAESGVIESPMQVVNDGGASGGQYVTVAAGNNSTGSSPAAGKVSISVNVEAGDYKIWGRVIAADGGDDSFWVQVDNGVIYKWNSFKNSTTWVWDEVHNTDAGSAPLVWNLSAGTHTIKFYYREDGAKLDKIYVTKNNDTPNARLFNAATESPEASVQNVTIYPNPNQGQSVNIQMATTVEQFKVEILSVTGTVYLEKEIKGNEAVISNLKLPAGIYLINTTAQGVKQTNRLIVR